MIPNFWHFQFLSSMLILVATHDTHPGMCASSIFYSINMAKEACAVEIIKVIISVSIGSAIPSSAFTQIQ